MATYRFRKNKIKCFQAEGLELHDESDKLQLATAFYRDFFTESREWEPNLNITTLYPEALPQLNNLDAPFSWGKILQTIRMAPANKSPGPDGFTNEFFKKYADDLKIELTELFQQLFDHRANLSGMNLAYITLLPKCQTPLQITDYRPVSLQHSIPKLFAEVLSNRLQVKIKQLVDPMQSGFIKGRSIIKNFAMAMEMIQCAP
jgi:hypothetical protein